jgi:hypothetical protein
MADPLSSLDGFLGGLDLNFANPVGLGINVLLSTIVGGIVILIVVEIFAKKFSQSVNPLNAFFVALIVSLINIFGILPVLGGLVGMIPFAGIITMLLPVIVWIVLIKVFFGEMEFVHALIIGVICYFLNIFLIPSLVVMAAGFVPL